jgi:hypothetical protein
MPGTATRRIIVMAAGALAATLAATGSAPAGAERGRSDEAGLEAVRALTRRYHTESVALADGFTATDECVPGMGYHYVNSSRLDTTLEPSRPEALLYAPTAEGGRRLAGAEWIVVDRDQNLGTDDDRPALFEHDFDGPMPGHGPGMPIHYDLHAYAWIENPDGGFATWNPTIACP